MLAMEATRFQAMDATRMLSDKIKSLILYSPM